MKIPDKCHQCLVRHLCRGGVDRHSVECNNFHKALESKLQSTASTNNERDVICPNCKSGNTMEYTQYRGMYSCNKCAEVWGKLTPVS